MTNATDPGDGWDVTGHSGISGPTIGTVKADSDAIRALAKWLGDTLTASDGLFGLGKSWLTDCQATGYPGAALNYDQYASRTAAQVTLAGPNVTPVGILPGYAADDQYLPYAKALKTLVDAQLAALYVMFAGDPSSSSMADGNIYDMVSTLVDTLNTVAADYDKGDAQIESDLGDLSNTFNQFTNNLGTNGGKGGTP